MNQLEKEQKLAALKTKYEMVEDEKHSLAEQIRALEAIPVKQEFKVWEPADREVYWDSSKMGDTFKANSADVYTIESGLAHPTKEAAERHHEFLKMLRELEKFAVEHNEGWKPDFNIGSEKHGISYEPVNGRVLIEIFVNKGMAYSILPYFKTRELAQKAIDTFGDRLKILFEYYNS